MIPVGGSILESIEEEADYPSRTWRLDFEKGRIAGYTDGADAVKQAIYKTLQTDRYEHEIYSFDYGHELRRLIGGDPLYVQSETVRLLKEALLRDERIEAVEDVRGETSGDSILVHFTILTVYDRLEITQEVSSSV